MADIGIDPGRGGGLVVLQNAEVVDAIKMPEDPNEVRDFLKNWHSTYTRVTIERIPKWCGYAQNQERNIPASALAVLYGNFQLCVGICVGLGMEWSVIAPQKWQSTVGCRNVTRLPYADWKRKLQTFAQAKTDRYVPQWMADALLIAEAGSILRTAA